MRRLVVIFLLFLLPTQVLAESLADLSHDIHGFPIEALESASKAYPLDKKPSTLKADLSSSQQMEHADIHDSLHSISYYPYSKSQFEPYFIYRLSNHPLSYPPLRRPPRL